MENLQVYRARFGGGTRLQIEADLHRGQRRIAWPNYAAVADALGSGLHVADTPASAIDVAYAGLSKVLQRALLPD